MGKLKKIGIGFGVIGGVFLIIIIASVVSFLMMTPEEREQLEAELQQENERLELAKQQENDHEN